MYHLIKHTYFILFFLLSPIEIIMKKKYVWSYKLLAYNPCKCMDTFKIKHKFYYKNINN